MPDLLTLAHFHPLLHQPFQLQLQDCALDLELVAAQALKHHPGLPRAPFVLVFRGPMQPILPQGIYPLQHPVLGRPEIFLVPFGADDVGHRYEAVFN